MSTPRSDAESISSAQRLSDANKRQRFSNASSLAILRSSTTPTLDNLTLTQIMNGETCHPIAFSDFATFCANKEHTSENLLFALWFRSYTARFNATPVEKRAKVPVPSTRLGDRYRPFAYLDQDRRDTVVESTLGIPTPELSIKEPDHTFRVCEWAASDTVPRVDQGRLQPSAMPLNATSILRPQLAPGTEYDKPQDQPLRQEAIRAFSTFLKKGGSRELGISDELREFAKNCLQRSTAPEVYLPIYEEVFQTLETQSLPHFLTYVKANVNKPKAVFWYMVGAADMLIGILIFLVLTLLLSRRHFAYRAIRLPSAIFIWFGSAQMYSAYRGFCSQVWGRVSSQLKPWELDMGDEEDLAASQPSTPPSMVRASVQGRPSDVRGPGRRSTHQSHGPSDSIASEMIFTPDARDTDLTLPAEVFPLSDLSGAACSTSGLGFSNMGDIPWLNSAPSEPSSSGTRHDDDEDEISDAARRRLAVRRDTIKVPDAALAFPIEVQPSLPSPGRSPQPPIWRARGHSEISPFDIPPQPSLPHMDGMNPGSPGIGGPLGTNEISPTHPPNDLTSNIELGALLENFELTTERRGATGKNRQGSKTTSVGSKSMDKVNERVARGKPKVKMFGPERVVQDARVKAHYESIVRHILIVGTAFGVVWIGVCFAVPTYGLI